MGMIHAIYHKREAHYREITEHLALALEQIIVGSVGTAQTDARVSRIAGVMVDNFNDPDFSIADEMRKSGYCTDHLRRLFRRAYGESPLEYLITLRVSYAERLMRRNAYLHYSVAEIATMSGFSDISYFSRTFKKRTGRSPREYMKEVQSPAQKEGFEKEETNGGFFDSVLAKDGKS